MSLTKKQIDKAARLYSLAIVANADSGGAENELETDVMDRSREFATAALARLGYDRFDLVTIQQCIDAARKG
ncbi:hypothetical protein A9R05_42170 (plasmid) [Burkholderia sp. KK1]|uniref:Uncharacterized protein n=1 Tax=Burkholderia sp. M701 TaxID=326454 RepID=V5YPM4_9BURK|nr:hypothetical protein [Burkholderia sp. M701]AQH05630.1 hypothetical protein A9R05_42170 [Burkholderia sp. KK1]BAO18891.1 hypothetical protein [Burkholderia sp. M701]